MKKLIYLPLLASVLLIGGCSTIKRVTGLAASTNDEAVSTAKFTLCNAASVGSIKRQFDTPEKVQTWKELCNDQTDFEP